MTMASAGVDASLSTGYKTIPDLVAGKIHDRIMSGEIPPGSHLRLSELAKEFGTSQMPIREAVRRLEALGLVDIHAHRGAFVRQLSKKDFEDTMEVRMILERTAIERAASRFSSDLADQARDLLARHNHMHSEGDEIAARELHTEFHHFLYRASGSDWLVRAIDPVWRNSERYRFGSSRDKHSHDGNHALEHEEIVAACESGNTIRAGEALLQHLSSASERMIRSMKSRQGVSEESP